MKKLSLNISKQFYRERLFFNFLSFALDSLHCIICEVLAIPFATFRESAKHTEVKYNERGVFIHKC